MEKPRPRKYQANPLRKYIADPGALGLFAFAVITFLSGAVHCKWIVSDVQSITATPGVFYGGSVQVIAGLLDMFRGEKVSGSTFIAFGMFWVSTGWMNWPGMAESMTVLYGGKRYYDAAVGWYLLGWSVIAAITTLAVIRTSILQVILLLLVTVDFSGLAICHLADTPKGLVGIGYVLVVTAALAFYIAAALLFKGVNGIHLPIFETTRARRAKPPWSWTSKSS